MLPRSFVKLCSLVVLTGINLNILVALWQYYKDIGPNVAFELGKYSKKNVYKAVRLTAWVDPSPEGVRKM